MEVDEKADAQSSTSGPDAYRCGARGGRPETRSERQNKGFGAPPHAALRSFYHDVKCRQCKQVVGRRYISTPESLRELMCVAPAS